jgi:hypothetical protein
MAEDEACGIHWGAQAQNQDHVIVSLDISSLSIVVFPIHSIGEDFIPRKFLAAESLHQR